MRPFLLAAAAVAAMAQDPAEGWLGYAQAVSPTGAGRITFAEAYWVNLRTPVEGGAFWSPWFGVETSDNLNLLQPVNPWPTKNVNSRAHTTAPGDLLYGNVTFNEESQSYTLVHADLTDGWAVSTTIPVQQNSDGSYKNYTIAYFVFEKPADCAQYAPDGQVTFTDIRIEWDGRAMAPTWTTGLVDDVCNNRAHVLNSTTVQITWDVNGQNPAPELIAARQQVGLQPPRRK